MKAWLVTVTIHQVFFFLNINVLIPQTHPFHLIGYPLASVHLPLLYFNILALIRQKQLSLWFTLPHFIPYLLCIGYLLYLQFFTASATLQVVEGFLKLPKDMPNFLGIANGLPMAAAGLIYVPLSFHALTKYQATLKTSYAALTGIDLNWVKSLVKLICFLFVSIFLLIFFSTDVHVFALTYVFRLVSSVLTCFIAYYGFRYQQQIERFFHQKMEQLQSKPKKYHSSGLKASEMQRISESISQALTQQQLYLDEEFTLQKLASQVNESPQKISETLNRLMGKTFYEFVNAHRIARAKKMLKDPTYATLSIEGIAFDCGFKSKSTFFKLFKKETGITPNQYKQQ